MAQGRYLVRSLAGLALFCVAAPALAEPADLVIYNAKVLTVDRKFSIQRAVAIRNGVIVAVGGNDVRKRFSAPRTIDLNGRVLMPGFTDTHIHVRGVSRREIDLSGAASMAELQAMIRAKAAELGPGVWITGYDWDEYRMAEQRIPLRQDLDVAAPNNPVQIIRAGGHSRVGNSAAIKIAGITRDTPDPERGVIEHDASGEPNGVIRERHDLYNKFVPPDSWEELQPSFVNALKNLLSLGITSLFEASGGIESGPVGPGGAASLPIVNSYDRMRAIYDREGETLPRMVMYIAYPGPEQLKKFPYHTGYGDDRLKLGPIGESSVDGGFTGPSAWTLVDYKGMPGFRGRPRLTAEQLQDLVDTSARLGWQLGLHAIGDAATEMMVAAYDKSLNTIPGQDHRGKDRRWFANHFTIMPPEATMKIMAKDNIMIAQQPNFAYSLEGRYTTTMDDWRVTHNNAVKTPHEKFGLFVAFGSDNVPVGPMLGLYAAVTRKGISGQVHGFEEEAVTLKEAIRMYTANGPYLSWDESKKGTIEVGKFADMIVLDKDILRVPVEYIPNIKVDMTFVAGKMLFSRN